MARSSESFNRRERARNKKLKADAKRERRQARHEPSGDGDEDAGPSHEVDEGDIIRQLEELTSSFDAGELEFEDYDRQRTDLLAQLVVE